MRETIRQIHPRLPAVHEANEKTLTIRPDPAGWKPFNLRKVTLKPAGEN